MMTQQEWQRQHDLVNGGCVPAYAYEECVEETKKQAWLALTTIAARHRFCDCTGTFPCEVRQVVDKFGEQFIGLARGLVEE